MVAAIWFLVIVFLPLILYVLHDIRSVLTDILCILKKGGAE